ncbi:glycosyltransferase family 2 protein [Candidatus Poribacteria bacterium]|nr:glycosyltransferase family 2 protein [Candidatus Poribacteria bacterium]MYG05762.1 glycosyltransferase family 2 protein [Candidatus Poribacteria bacterium]MYK24178.1 glycosyltransferase family 2 protein [Candidatus Poribacteria bacterium]
MVVSVIIPAFNEEQTIRQVIEAVHSVPMKKQIIVVNDGSTDGTDKILEALRTVHELTVVHCKENSGKGFAIRSGLPYVKGEAVVIQDADMELVPTDLVDLLKPFERNDVQVVYGSRFLNGRGNASVHNFIANRLLATYTNLLYGCRITDESTGYKAFSTELIMRLNLTCEGFEFCPEVTAKILRAGYRIYEVPVSYFPRTKKEGKKLRFWSDGLFAAWTLLKYRFTSKTELFKNTAQDELRQ